MVNRPGELAEQVLDHGCLAHTRIKAEEVMIMREVVFSHGCESNSKI